MLAFVTKKNIPNGVKNKIKYIILIKIKYVPSQKSFITSILFDFIDLIDIPIKMLNKIMNNIFPEAIEVNILPENIFKKNELKVYSFWEFIIKSISDLLLSPSRDPAPIPSDNPGETKFTIVIPIRIAAELDKI
tara:strand:- start:42 stop:443 length:402 start_codon:yes stop_codon:yes gene_type:complete